MDEKAALPELKKPEGSISSEQQLGVEITPELDGIHDGLEFPTEEEKATLRRVADTIPWNAYREFDCAHCEQILMVTTHLVIAFVELAERFSYYGSTVVFVSCPITFFIEPTQPKHISP